MLTSVTLFSATAVLLGYLHDYHHVNGWVASAYRSGIGLLVVLALQTRTGKLELVRIFTRPLLLTRGIIGGLTIPIYYIAIMELGPGRAGMLSGSYPLFASIFAVGLLGEALKRHYFIYISIALIGMIGVLSSNGIEASKPIYDLLAIAGAVAGGICVVLIRHLRHTESTSNIFAAQCVFAFIIGLTGSGGHLWIEDFSVLAMLLLASFMVVGAQLAITQAFRTVDVATGTTLQMLTPVITVVTSALILGESFGLIEIMGGSAILYASYRIVLAKS